MSCPWLLGNEIAMKTNRLLYSLAGVLSPRWRICVLTGGYAIMLLAGLSMFRIPFYIGLGLLLIGTWLVVLSPVKSAPWGWRSMLVYLLGVIAQIFAVLYYGLQRVDHWTPNSNEMFVAWLVCFCGFRHVYHAISAIKDCPKSGKVVS